MDLHLIRHNDRDPQEIGQEGEEYMEMGMDLSFFVKFVEFDRGEYCLSFRRSAEWDLMNLTSARHAVLYASCCGPETFASSVGGNVFLVLQLCGHHLLLGVAPQNPLLHVQFE